MSIVISGMQVSICRCLMLLGMMSWCAVSNAQDALNKGTLHVTSGTMLFIGGNFTNDTTGGTENNGDIELDGDWINHGSYLDTVGTVYLTGPSQLITGSVSTTFNNLNTQGTGIKTVTLDATVTGVLALNDLEMATDSNTLFITYSDTSAITRTSGFVSSQGPGSLSRSTGMSIPYLFPVGSSIGTLRYRPVEITPTSAAPHTFTVRMANVDPSTEGYNTSNKQPGIGPVNANWYHRINRTTGTSPADLTIFKDGLEPGSEMVHWETEWENSGVVSATPTSVTKLAWNDFSPDPFALSEEVVVVDAGNDTTVCSGVDVQLQASLIGGIGPYAYMWTPGAGLNDSTIANPLLSNVSAGMAYSLSVYDSGTGSLSLKDTIVIIVNPSYGTGATVSICQGDSVQLPGGSYATTAGTFNDTLTTTSGCDSVVATTVTVDSAYLTPASASICQGDSVQLPGGSYASTAGTSFDTLTSITGCDSVIAITVTVESVLLVSVAISICQGDSLQLLGGTYASIAGTYYDTLITTTGCDSIIETTLSVQPSPSATIAGDTSICIGSSVLLTASGGSNYQWSTGDTNFSITITPLSTMTYSVEVSNPGCPVTDSVAFTINVNSIPIITALPDIASIIQGESVGLSANGGVEYIWTPAGSLDDPFSSNPTASPIATTLYSVSGTDVNGCSNTDSVLITVSQDFAIGVPNIFSPNSDGQNDVLLVSEEGVDWILFMIYDRWGEKVFESREVSQGWDGTFRGSPMNPSVFVYYIEGAFTDGKEILKHGNITLVR
ncbi:MAG: gliding motility-associated C-terminal domain-containing protein [Flavobacteriales bacterium]|nr:gliding motility-associated C-terminal domain-containing protein [Flavobacteriales bacterium]